MIRFLKCVVPLFLFLAAASCTTIQIPTPLAYPPAKPGLEPYTNLLHTQAMTGDDCGMETTLKVLADVVADLERIHPVTKSEQDRAKTLILGAYKEFKMMSKSGKAGSFVTFETEMKNRLRELIPLLFNPEKQKEVYPSWLMEWLNSFR